MPDTAATWPGVPPRARSQGHQRSITVNPVIYRRVPAGQYFTGQDHDPCPIFQTGYAGSTPASAPPHLPTDPATPPDLEKDHRHESNYSKGAPLSMRKRQDPSSCWRKTTAARSLNVSVSPSELVFRRVCSTVFRAISPTR